MKQALLNLLINAMDASGEGDAITITTEASGALLKISVQDTGRGISPEDVEKIFKPFYTTKTRGSGLGLAIVDRILKEHGGRIEVDSAPGCGATFTMELPAHDYAKT
jgi:signal transduction histidine kinase